MEILKSIHHMDYQVNPVSLIISTILLIFNYQRIKNKEEIAKFLIFPMIACFIIDYVNNDSIAMPFYTIFFTLFYKPLIIIIFLSQIDRIFFSHKHDKNTYLCFVYLLEMIDINIFHGFLNMNIRLHVPSRFRFLNIMSNFTSFLQKEYPNMIIDENSLRNLFSMAVLGKELKKYECLPHLSPDSYHMMDSYQDAILNIEKYNNLYLAMNESDLEKRVMMMYNTGHYYITNEIADKYIGFIPYGKHGIYSPFFSRSWSFLYLNSVNKGDLDVIDSEDRHLSGKLLISYGNIIKYVTFTADEIIMCLKNGSIDAYGNPFNDIRDLQDLCRIYISLYKENVLSIFKEENLGKILQINLILKDNQSHEKFFEENLNENEKAEARKLINEFMSLNENDDESRIKFSLRDVSDNVNSFFDRLPVLSVTYNSFKAFKEKSITECVITIPTTIRRIRSGIPSYLI